jgi:hypothetical protein
MHPAAEMAKVVMHCVVAVGRTDPFVVTERLAGCHQNPVGRENNQRTEISKVGQNEVSRRGTSSAGAESRGDSVT